MMSERCFKDNVYTITQKKWSLVDIYELFENFNIVTDNHTDKIVEPLEGECYLFYKESGPQDYKCDGYRWRNQRYRLKFVLASCCLN